MISGQTAVGSLTAGLCLLGLWQSRRLLAETGKGRWLAARFGDSAGMWALRGLSAGGVLFGVLLAADVIRPVQW